jgi:hypothetical protein
MPEENAGAKYDKWAQDTELPSVEAMSQEERIAYNESWSRHLNERKAEWVESGQQVGGFRCECWRADCIERLPLSGREWREVRSRANRFAVAPGHIASDVESVVEEYPHFWMVEKHGKAGELAEQLK